MKRILCLLILLSILSLGCVEREGCNLPRDCEGRPHADCISDWLCIDGKCVWGCGNCSLSLCDCKCHLEGETPEEKTGRLCGINCLQQYNVSGCEYRNGRCVEIYKEPVECTNDSDCGTGGCSGQVCGLKDMVKDIITTCEYRPEYDCLNLTSCRCFDGRCQWEDNLAYIECMQNLTTGLSNPASVYCEEQGFGLEIRTDENGSYGVCVFPDGSECEEWAFYHRECNYTGEKGTDLCDSAEDCVPAQCCHPTSCINRDYAADCSGIGCTTECSRGTMDCGCGSCDCINNTCRVVWNETNCPTV
jgi:eight-cysteine-cluster-containing protein